MNMFSYASRGWNAKDSCRIHAGLTEARRQTGVATLVSFLLLTGCATHNLSPVALERDPGINVRKDESFRHSTYGTFSVFPLSRVTTGLHPTDENLDKSNLFMLRNAFEGRGYRFVNLNESPDFLTTISLSTSSVEKIPQIMESPESPADGMISRPQVVATLLGDRAAAAGWGSWSPPSRFTSPLPEYPPPPGTTPAKKPRNFTLTNLSVCVIDAKTFKEVWTGAGRGISRTPSPRVNSQLILHSVAQRFPACATPELITRAGVPGLEVEILTNDDIHYFPAVTAVRSGSPALKGGLKKWDMILAIDARSVANRPYAHFRSRLAGESGTNLTMTIWRNGSQMHAKIPRRHYPASVAGGDTSENNQSSSYLMIPRKTANTNLIISGVSAAALIAIVLIAAGS